jgi:hypothetical protein
MCLPFRYTVKIGRYIIQEDNLVELVTRKKIVGTIWYKYFDVEEALEVLMGSICCSEIRIFSMVGNTRCNDSWVVA